MTIERIDRLRGLFEKRLKRDKTLSVEEFLAEYSLAGDGPLLEELRKLEAEYRNGRNGPGRAHQNLPAADFDNLTTLAAGPSGESKIGHYKLLQKIGEGGMGIVYMAEQTHPVSRRVALKVIKPGMDSREVLARFEAERQALALMDHPNIARVLDVGTTDSGLPYFVMELVKGVPITNYCDEKQLAPKERLELFMPICLAVQHAHQKGIIHRDIKPSNVLIAQYDNRPVPKIIDFGLAKAIGQRLTEKTMFTQFGQIVGTIDYMSPEQASFNQLDVDTRSDIYSLGVMLYELLTGETPFDKKRLHAAAFDEMLRIIRQEEPPRPSVRLSSHASLPTTDAKRRVETKKLSLLVRGELDWIVMKAIDKERDRRYQTAGNFADDIRRYLSQETVLACPPSAGYQLQKFTRRNKAAMAIAAVLVLALMSLAAAGVQALNRRSLIVARDQKEAERQRAAEARQRAEEALIGEQEARTALANSNEKLTQSHEEKDRYLYFNRIGLAEREWFLNNNGDRTREYLAQCPPEKRGWEWHYLDRLAHNITRLSAGETIYLTCAFTPNGSHVAASDYQDAIVRIFDCRDQRQVLSFPAQGIQLNCDGLAISPDGKWLAVAGGYENRQSKVRVWDWARLLREGRDYAGISLESETGAECNLAFSHDSRFLAIVSGTIVGNAGWVRVYRTEGMSGNRTPDIAWSAQAEPGYFFGGVSLSPDGRFLVAGDQVRPRGFGNPEAPTYVTVWEWETDRKLTRLVAHQGAMNDVDFSPDGRWVASCADDGISKLWEWDAAAESLREHATLRGHTASIRSLAFEPDVNGVRLATCSEDRTLKIWDRQSGKERITLRGHSGEVYDVAFHPDGRQIASAGTDSVIGLWDIDRLEQEHLLEGHSDTIEDVAISPDGRWAVSTCIDGSVRWWDLVRGVSEVLIHEPRRQFHSVAISPDGSWFAVGEGDFSQRDQKGELFVWSAPTRKLHFQLPDHTAIVWDVAFSRDSSLLATAGGELESGPGGINIWDVRAGRQLRHLPQPDANLDGQPHFGVKSVGFSADGTKVFGISRASKLNTDEMLIRWDLSPQPAERKTWMLPASRGMNLCVSPDGGIVAVAAWGSVLVYDVDNGELRNRIPLHGGDIMGVAFSPDGRYLASAGSDHHLKLYDREFEQEVLTLHGHTGPVFTLAFSPDGNRLYSAGADAVVRMWDATPRIATK